MDTMNPNRMPSLRGRRTLIGLMTAGLALGACGSKADQEPTVPTSSPASTTSVEAAPTSTQVTFAGGEIRCNESSQPGCDGLTDPTCKAPEGYPDDQIMRRNDEGICEPTSYAPHPAQP